MRPAGAFLALALGVVSPLLAGGDAERGTVAVAQTMNHAAVVVDTGDGVVRKMCLAFPEAEISGIEALRRVDTRPNRFETFGARGVAVCMLCGVGCPDGDCFCDPERFWAYHRAGPGESGYDFSATGAGSTKVRNGDVEAWRWGGGEPPPKTTVSEVCSVPEPPARSSRATTTTSAAAPPPTESPSTTTASVAASTTTAAPPAPSAAEDAARESGPTATTPPAQATPGSISTDAGGPPSTAGEEADVAAPDPQRAPTGASTRGTGVPAADGAEGSSPGQLASLAAFTGLLGGLLLWRSRLRRANVRRTGPVR